ncbi:Mitochondrial brown fat uncoupling protein [Artemisia annua]|uniref:Mitochondrial brown fat uncoupling protein n=1 Tax=Artemisia annua TaxID=35608 RepID=A0A2U1MNS1_ARTAN|nr:Mitochondrial brown fat uncoupling protein [Artemisia annua]
MERHCPWFTSPLLVWWFKNQLIKNLYVGNNFVGDVPLTTKILAFLTSALSISVANPTDLVKVLIQAEGKLAPCVPRHYSSALNAYSKSLDNTCFIKSELTQFLNGVFEPFLGAFWSFCIEIQVSAITKKFSGMSFYTKSLLSTKHENVI